MWKFLSTVMLATLLSVPDADAGQLHGARFQNLIFMGDSLTAGTGSTGGLTYPFDISTSWSPQRWYYNGGVPADTSSQILTRYLALDGNYQNGTLILWSGNNNFSDGTQVQADIAATIAAHNAAGGNNRDFVLGITNGEYPSEHAGQPNYDLIIALNSALASTYGARYVDERNFLVTQYDPSNLMDVYDHTGDVVPYTLRSVNINGNLTQALNASDISFTTNASFANNYTLKIDNEYILVNSVSGTTITNSVRGYGGSIAATHSNGVAILGTDPVHLSNAGYALVSGLVQGPLRANGW